MSSNNDQPETVPAPEDTTSGDAAQLEVTPSHDVDAGEDAYKGDIESMPATGSAEPDGTPASDTEQPSTSEEFVDEGPTELPSTSATPDMALPADSATEASAQTSNTDAPSGDGSESSTLKMDSNLSEPEATRDPALTGDSSKPSTPSSTDGSGGTETDASSPSSGEDEQSLQEKPTDEMSAEEMAEYTGALPSFPMPAQNPNPINPCTGLPLKDEPESKDSAVVKACEEASK